MQGAKDVLIDLPVTSLAGSPEVCIAAFSLALTKGSFAADQGELEFCYSYSDGSEERFLYSFASMGSVWIMHLGGLLSELLSLDRRRRRERPKRAPLVVFDVPHPQWSDGGGVKVLVGDFAERPGLRSDDELSSVEIVLLHDVGSKPSSPCVQGPCYLLRRVLLSRAELAIQGRNLAERILRERTEATNRVMADIEENGLESYLGRRGQKSTRDPVFSLVALSFECTLVSG